MKGGYVCALAASFLSPFLLSFLPSSHPSVLLSFRPSLFFCFLLSFFPRAWCKEPPPARLNGGGGGGSGASGGASTGISLLTEHFVLQYIYYLNTLSWNTHND
jgi:hypothetical protein